MVVEQTTQVGDPCIRIQAKEVTDFNSEETKKVVTDLIDSMRHHDLVGMAAPQIGKSVRIFVTEIRETPTRKEQGIEDDAVRVFINPRIVSYSDQKVSDWEGCGSVAHAGLFGKVERFEALSVEACDENGSHFTLDAEGLLARIIQHEMDHLEGVVFTDSADPKTFMSRDEYIKMRQGT